MILIELRH